VLRITSSNPSKNEGEYPITFNEIFVGNSSHFLFVTFGCIAKKHKPQGLSYVILIKKAVIMSFSTSD